MKYDLLSVVLIGMGTEEESKNGSELHRILSILLSKIWKPAEKEKYLQEEYGFDVGHEMKGVWRDMCNLSELIEEKGIEKGIEKGTYRTLCKLVCSGKLTIEDAAATADISVEEMSRIIEENK